MAKQVLRHAVPEYAGVNGGGCGGGALQALTGLTLLPPSRYTAPGLYGSFSPAILEQHCFPAIMVVAKHGF